jgi:signal-transduction protein with cAMP-binding, CBS, and nucleotidyltransferase domain
MAGQSLKLVRPLLDVPLFAGLRPLQITEIARHADRIKFRPGSVIVSAGQALDGAYLIVEGQAEFRTATESWVPPACIEAGSLIGEVAMFVEYTAPSTVAAVERVNCMIFTRAAMLAQMEDEPTVAQHFESIYAERLNLAAVELREIDTLLERAAQAATTAA